MTELPEIGLLTMSYKPRLTLNAIKEACSQTYPLDKITLYLLYQKNAKGEYPRHYQATLPIKLVQINVPGKWTALWMFKFIMFFASCKELFMAVWDEDDYYEPGYLKKTIKQLVANPKLVYTWNFMMLFCRRGKIAMERYNSAYGTIVGRTDALRKAALAFQKLHPNGLIKTRKPQSAGGGFGWVGPLDGPFRRFLAQMYGGKYAEHNAVRWYVFSEDANTRSHGRRNPMESIDFGGYSEPKINISEISFITMKDGAIIHLADMDVEKKVKKEKPKHD